MQTVAETINRMSDSDMQDTLQAMSVLAEPLTEKIIRDLNDHGSVDIRDIPERFGEPNVKIMSRLAKLERSGFVKCTKSTDDGIMTKSYEINEIGRRVLENAAMTPPL